MGTLTNRTPLADSNSVSVPDSPAAGPLTIRLVPGDGKTVPKGKTRLRPLEVELLSSDDRVRAGHRSGSLRPEARSRKLQEIRMILQCHRDSFWRTPAQDCGVDFAERTRN